jgi:hypothetical protein
MNKQKEDLLCVCYTWSCNNFQMIHISCQRSSLVTKPGFEYDPETQIPWLQHKFHGCHVWRWDQFNQISRMSTISRDINAVWSVESQLKFWRNISPPSSGSNKPSEIPVWKRVTSCLVQGASYLLSRWYLARLIRPWRWRRYVPPKLQLTSNGLHGIIAQKRAHFITTAVRTSNLPNLKNVFYINLFLVHVTAFQ